MKAVKRPGSLDSSAALIVCCQAERRRRAREVHEGVRKRALREGDDDLTAASAPFPDWIRSYHLRPVGIREHLGLSREEIGEEAHVVGVVGDDEKVERARELHRLAAGGVISSPRAKR